MTTSGIDPESRRRDQRQFRRAFWIAAGFVLLLWWIKLLEVFFGEALTGLGVRPGSWPGLIGVLTGPLIHGSFDHLIANSLPLLILGTLSFYAYPRASARALPLMWIVGGLGTWLIGRPSTHFGASGLTHGLMFFLFLLGVIRWERRAIATAMVTFLLYGGMLLTVLPREPGISWEYHLCGAIGGALGAILWRALDPKPPVKKYDYEIEEEMEREMAERAAADAAQFELPRPEQVPVLWHRPARESGASVIPFPTARHADIDTEPPSTQRH